MHGRREGTAGESARLASWCRAAKAFRGLAERTAGERCRAGEAYAGRVVASGAAGPMLDDTLRSHLGAMSACWANVRSERDVEETEEARLSERRYSGGSGEGLFDAWREQTDHGMGPSR